MVSVICPRIGAPSKQLRPGAGGLKWIDRSGEAEPCLALAVPLPAYAGIVEEPHVGVAERRARSDPGADPAATLRRGLRERRRAGRRRLRPGLLLLRGLP